MSGEQPAFVYSSTDEYNIFSRQTDVRSEPYTHEQFCYTYV